jgi:hypothetical protein
MLGAEISMVSRAGSLGRPVGAGDDARALPLRQCLLAARCAHARLLRQDQHPEQYRLSRLRRTAGRDCHREHLDTVARSLGRDPLDVRRVNFYGKDERNITPYEQS